MAYPTRQYIIASRETEINIGRNFSIAFRCRGICRAIFIFFSPVLTVWTAEFIFRKKLLRDT